MPSRDNKVTKHAKKVSHSRRLRKLAARLPQVSSGFRISESMEENKIEAPKREKCYTTSIQYSCGHITNLHYITHIDCEGVPPSKVHCDNVALTPKVMFTERNCYDCNHPPPAYKINTTANTLPESQAHISAFVLPTIHTSEPSQNAVKSKEEVKEDEVHEESWVDVGLEKEIEGEEGWVMA
ncbi:uncharacterized protein PAC_16141 [Phialocephala subalpina]|uniref:Uncharacterized protein n=1 Tax=Phialocephala subalpina TaxID=576137 RepID=A0A1L7XMF8_9HELO|nr:uncharacterized protein PAC_16141 [Phialocephala subalpina]